MFEPNPALDAQLAGELNGLSDAIAGEYKAFLVEKLSGPGSGTHWPGQPNPSSAPGQYPGEQSGALVDSIDARREGDTWEVGSFDAPPEAFALEYPSPPGSPITRQSDHGARPWLSKSLTDPELHRRLEEVLP